MDSVVGEDQTLPVDINGSCSLSRLPLNAGDFSMDNMTAPSFPDKMSPSKILAMKDYENQITALKKENFNLKLRIYFMEERMQQNCDDSTENVFKTNIELKVEVESMKRDLAEKQELLVAASKALESLAGRESGDVQRVREQARRETDALRQTLAHKISVLEEDLRNAQEELDKMASLAEQEKLRNIEMEKQLLTLGATPSDSQGNGLVHQLQQALQEKNSVIEQLRQSLQNQEAVRQQFPQTTDQLRQLSALIGQKDQELQALRVELDREKNRTQTDLQGFTKSQSEVNRLESTNQQLNKELGQIQGTNQNLTKTLEDVQSQSKVVGAKLEEMEKELSSERKNSMKRDKTIQGLTLVLKEKEKEIEELCHEIQDRDEALSKAREAAHKAQLQKYQGAEEHQSLLMEKQAELAQLQGDHHAKLLEAQKLQRSLGRREQELGDMQQAKEQLEVDLEDLQQQKKKGDKALNDLQNQLKKLSGELAERESALEHQYQELLEQSKRKLHHHEVTIQRLTSSLADKEQQLQEYMNMARDFETSRSPAGSDVMLTKLRERLREKEKALEEALDERFAALEEKDNEIHQLQLALREKERDLERLNNLLTHNEDTINSFDTLIKEKDVELQHQVNTLKNLQRAKQEAEDNLSRALREKDAIISQLQLSLEGKTKDMEEMAGAMLSQSQSQARDLAEQMGQRLKVTEAMLAEAVKARERLVTDNESAVEGLLATINSKDQLLKESAERSNRTLSERAHEIQEVKRQLSESQQQLASAQKHSTTATQEGYLETAELRALVAEKDSIINKLLERSQERDQYLAELRLKESPASGLGVPGSGLGVPGSGLGLPGSEMGLPGFGLGPPGSGPQVLELTHTIHLLQERLDDKEAELSRRNNNEDNMEKAPQHKKNVLLLKKELAQRTEALNKALKRENQLKISLAELQAVLSELEGRVEGQAASMESLTSTLETKDQIIHDLHQRLSRRGSSQTGSTQDQSSRTGEEQSLPGLPQRERTIIGGDSQQEALPSLVTLQVEHVALNRALRAEQQLYSGLVRTVKEQDSAQRLQALQLELTAVTLLRQQLEEGIKTNQALRDHLEGEVHRSRAREGDAHTTTHSADRVDPKELELTRHQLEDAQRWNASLQARLGAIQNRGGGVGATHDSADTLSFIADQTSYMSICVGEGLEEGLANLSAPELRDKVLELQELVSRLQALNGDLQRRLTIQTESPDMEPASRDTHGHSLASTSPGKQPCVSHSPAIPFHYTRCRAMDASLPPSDGASVRASALDQQAAAEPPKAGSASQESGLGDMEDGDPLLRSLLADCGAASASQLREEVRRLRGANAELRGLLKEHISTEAKESGDSSGDGSDGPADPRTTVERLRAEAKGHRKVIGLLKDQLERAAASWGPPNGDAPPRSRLPVPVRTRTASTAQSGSRESVNSGERPDRLKPEPLQHLALDSVFGPDQHLVLDSVFGPGQHSTPDSGFPPSTEPRNAFSEDSIESLESGQNHDQSRDLLTQLDLLHQECQEKEALIGRLEEQASEWEDLREQLQEKDLLNRQYLEALQAAESTIAYLTACSLDSQAGLGGSGSGLASVGSGPVSGGGGGGGGGEGTDGALQRRCLELQQALQEKEKLNGQLVECLNMAEAAISSLGQASPSGGVRGDPDPRALCERLEAALSRRVAASPERRDRPGAPRGRGEPDAERQADGPQEALWEQSAVDAQRQEKPRSAQAEQSQGKAGPAGPEESHGDRRTGGRRRREPSGVENDDMASSTGGRSGGNQDQAAQRLSECLRAAEDAVAMLTAHSSSCCSPGSTQSASDLQHHLERLHRALLEREALGRPGNMTRPSLQTAGTSRHNTQKPVRNGAGTSETPSSSPLNLHGNLCLLQRVFSEHGRRLAELQAALEEERSRARPRELGAGASSQENQAQLESLQKALREKRRTCKSLEEKLAWAQNVLALQTAANKTGCHGALLNAPPLEQEDKGVQVDLQDLGYETSGRSEVEVDREEEEEEESGSTDLGRHGLQLVGSVSSSLPSLMKENHDQNTFSSMENLDSGSSTSYPSSPTLSSPKVSLKGLLAFQDYGATEDPSQLQAQVRELRAQLESQTRVALHLQSLLLRRNSLSSDLLTATTPDPATGSQDLDGAGRRESRAPDRSARGGEEEEEGGKQGMKEKISHLHGELERERSLNRSMNERLQQAQHRSRSASPARLDSLVQSQARELSQLRQQIKDSRGLGALQRRQLEELSTAFQELLQASDVDYYLGEVFREQLDKSLNVLDRLEGRLEKGDGHLDNEDGAALELAQRLSKELQEKNRLVEVLQNQLRGQSPSSHHSCSQSDLSERASSYYPDSPTGGARTGSHGGKELGEGAGGPAQRDLHPAGDRGGGGGGGGGASGPGGVSTRVQSLRRENGRLQERLRGSQELNATLRSELDLHRSLLVQTSTATQNQAQNQAQAQGVRGSTGQAPLGSEGQRSLRQDSAQHGTMDAELLAEHLQEIRALWQRLEETIHTNDRLREQLERRLAEVERDPAATNIFIQGSDEHGQLTSEMRFLWGQNQELKEQLNQGSRDKQKENEKLREALARRTAKLEQSRKEVLLLREEKSRLEERVERSEQENTGLQEALSYSREEVHRLQCEGKHQRQQLSDCQHLLQSLRVELQVYEQIKTGTHKHTESREMAQQSGTGPGTAPAPGPGTAPAPGPGTAPAPGPGTAPAPGPGTAPAPGPGSGPLDLSELLLEIRHLRLQLERSIQTNTALRQRLEEQLLRGPQRPDTININYMLSTSDEGGRSPGREGCDLLRPSPHSHTDPPKAYQERRRRAQAEETDGVSQCASLSSGDSLAAAPPSRLVPGHRLWAHPGGRHVLGLMEDHDALRKQISEGRRLTRGMDAQLQECLHACRQEQGTDGRVVKQHQLKALSSSMNTMQQVLEEAGRLLKLVWRVSLPSSESIAGGSANNQQGELLENEIARLKSRLSQQEKMLSGAIKRLRTTNHLKEGMERVIVDQLSLTHGVLKKARGNLEDVPVNGQ
ncbi:CDK5 regulatory subunit-associated protein 2 [Aplochiton taeniatus]